MTMERPGIEDSVDTSDIALASTEALASPRSTATDHATTDDAATIKTATNKTGSSDPVRGVALLILLAVIGSGGNGVSRYFGMVEVPKSNFRAGNVADSNVPDSTASSIQFQVNLNEATLQELALLPMVGPRMAELIVQERARLGAFTELEQLSKIPGIGPKVMESLRPHVTVR